MPDATGVATDYELVTTPTVCLLAPFRLLETTTPRPRTQTHVRLPCASYLIWQWLLLWRPAGGAPPRTMPKDKTRMGVGQTRGGGGGVPGSSLLSARINHTVSGAVASFALYKGSKQANAKLHHIRCLV
jgi:hypothetical protein